MIFGIAVLTNSANSFFGFCLMETKFSVVYIFLRTRSNNTKKLRVNRLPVAVVKEAQSLQPIQNQKRIGYYWLLPNHVVCF